MGQCDDNAMASIVVGCDIILLPTVTDCDVTINN